MSAYEDNLQNQHNPEEEHRGTYWERSRERADRYYHETENFLYRYRWAIVLLIALVLVAVVLVMKRDKVAQVLHIGKANPVTSGKLNIATAPNPNIGSDVAQIWGF